LLSCEQNANDIFEELNYFSKNVNYEFIFGICPNNCLGVGKVYGRGLHHPESSICLSAIADFSIPMNGGVIG